MEEVKKFVFRFLIRILIFLWGLIIILILFSFSHKLVIVSGSSMDPTLNDGDIVLSSICTDITIGDIYMFQEPDQGYFVVKRLCGIPGDLIQLKDGALYRNGTLVMDAVGDSWDNMTFNLGTDDYLFLGDNRAESYDGRYWKSYVHLKDIKYRLTTIIFPFHRQSSVVWEG